MGCCYSFFCNDDGNAQNGEANERTHLLVDPVSNNISIQRNNSEDFLSHESGSLPKKTDEQSALNRILQETATNVIDVAALNSHNMQQHEYLERMKTYGARLQHIGEQQSRLNSARNGAGTTRLMLLHDVPSAEKLLASEPISKDDYDYVTSVILKASHAISDIKVEHKEDLVVPFRIP